MIYKVSAVDPNAPVIVLDIGNSNIDLATWHEQDLKAPLTIETADHGAFEEAFQAHLDSIPAGKTPAVVAASVVPKAAVRIRDYVEDKLDRNVLWVGEKIPLPLEVGVTEPQTIGVDRVCAAAAGFDKLNSTCIIVGFGTAVTVDLVDADGILLGGAILPGVRMQLCALHEHTAQLPDVEPALPELPYGRDTAEAIQTGVCRGIIGAVRTLVEGYATVLNFWPQVVGTGGDLALLGPGCDFLDTQVSHLALRGVGLAYTKHFKAANA